jgi:glycosyltransferase involved in cell wall biosynthesis
MISTPTITPADATGQTVSPTLSVCIATHERPALLKVTLGHLAAQEELPDEVVVSDSSAGSATAKVLEQFRVVYPGIQVKHVKSGNKALPWQRWWAFLHSRGDVILFLDDDIRLVPRALRRLKELYREEGAGSPIIGAGLLISLEDGALWERQRRSLPERILATSRSKPGALTPGGISVSPSDLPRGPATAVEWLSGGTMSLRRSALTAIGEMQGLFGLYDLQIGCQEDAVLSSMAARLTGGRLVMLADGLAFHPPLARAIRTADAHAGWHKGLRETLGRAHAMRWLATSRRSLVLDWLRTVALEILRAGTSVVRRPLSRADWNRLAGGVYGAILGLCVWRRIPDQPQQRIALGSIPWLMR